MMRTLLPQQAPPSPNILTRSQPKNMLAHRLFDTPSIRGQSQRRPRVFSNEGAQTKLTPSIVK